MFVRAQEGQGPRNQERKEEKTGMAQIITKMTARKLLLAQVAAGVRLHPWIVLWVTNFSAIAIISVWNLINVLFTGLTRNRKHNDLPDRDLDQ